MLDMLLRRAGQRRAGQGRAGLCGQGSFTRVTAKIGFCTAQTAILGEAMKDAIRAGGGNNSSRPEAAATQHCAIYYHSINLKANHNRHMAAMT